MFGWILQAALRLQPEEGSIGGVRMTCSAYLDAWSRLHSPLAFLQPLASIGHQGRATPLALVRGGGPLLGLLMPGARAQQLLSTPHLSALVRTHA